MEPVVALTITAAVIGLAGVLALILRSRSGRTRHGGDSVFRPGDLPGLERLGDTATLVQFSTEFCARCPGTRRELQRITADRHDLLHVEVDLTNDPALASRLRILQTPTVFVLDAQGRVATRIGGPPRPVDLRVVLDRLSEPDSRPSVVSHRAKGSA